MDTSRRSTLAHTHLGDLDVAYEVAGVGSPVVLLHGLGQDRRIWAEIQSKWPERTTYAYDLRGHGGTTIGRPDGTIEQFGGDLIAFLLEVGPAWCVGFSLGGSIALWASAERPDLIHGVVAVATSSVVGGSAAVSMEQRIAEVEQGGVSRLTEILAEDTVAQLAGAPVDVDHIVRDRLAAVGDGLGYLNGARAVCRMHEVSLNDRLADVHQPVLVVSGSLDPWCPPRAAEIMLKQLPNARFEELAGVGHLVTDVAGDQLLTVSRRWLEEEENQL